LRQIENLQHCYCRIAFREICQGATSRLSVGGQFLSSFPRAFAISILFAGLQGCAADRAAVFAVAPGVAVELQDLSRRAAAGDKPAQYELGLAFAGGEGVAVDRCRAARLLRLAARDDTEQPAIVYLPPAGKVPGRVMHVNAGRRSPGLPQASRSLDSLLAHGDPCA